MKPDHPAKTSTQQSLIACQECDALYHARLLDEGEHITCTHCGHHIFSNRKNSQQRAAAFAIASIFFLLLSHSFSFITLEIGGRANEVHLIGTVNAFFENDRPLLGISVILFIIMAPILTICGLLYLLIPILLGKKPSGGISICRIMYSMIPWNMLEVFLAGVLVSIIKLKDLATVELGYSFWALIGLIICISAAFISIDKHEVWEEVSS